MPVVGAEEQVTEYGAAVHHRHRLIQVGLLRAVNPYLGHETSHLTPQQHPTRPGILFSSQGPSLPAAPLSHRPGKEDAKAAPWRPLGDRKSVV